MTTGLGTMEQLSNTAINFITQAGITHGHLEKPLKALPPHNKQIRIIKEPDEKKVIAVLQWNKLKAVRISNPDLAITSGFMALANKKALTKRPLSDGGVSTHFSHGNVNVIFGFDIDDDGSGTS